MIGGLKRVWIDSKLVEFVPYIESFEVIWFDFWVSGASISRAVFLVWTVVVSSFNTEQFL